MKPTSEKQKAYMKEWYKRNKKHHIAKVRARQIETNYEAEKTKKQRCVRYVKRRTRLLYPIIGKRCEFCVLPATEHHYYTSSPKKDKFNFVCHDCHMEKDLKMGNHSKIQQLNLIGGKK